MTGFDLFLKICPAVDYAHRNLTVHRGDLSRACSYNIRWRGQAVDFGLAKPIDEPGGEKDQTATVPGIHAA
ncbi:MAG: hypothetical protein IPM21_12025 [Acidobacteria bacterium]|nr:hypothetical protein [Acidobacteriota bacterium]